MASQQSPEEPQPGLSRWSGALHIYLGAVPGVGKTHAMLVEGRRLAALGVDVVVGLLETHGRSGLEEALGDLEVIPEISIDYRGSLFGELDVDAILTRHPAVVLVDELAHTNVPGSRHEKRWQDVHELLSSGIEVITTLNVVHLSELHDAVENITGISQREFVPEALVLAADRIDLVDADPGVVLNRLRSSGSRNPTLGVFGDLDRLDMLRRLARTWMIEHNLGASIEAGPAIATLPGPVVVALAPGAPAGRAVRRAAQLAALRHAPLVGVSVRDSTGVGAAITHNAASLERMLAEFGGRYAEVGGTDIAAELAGFAAREGAAVLVIGDTSHSRGHRFLHGSVARRTLRLVGPIEVYVVPPSPVRLRRPVPAEARGPTRRRTALPPRRRAASWLLAVVAPIALMAALTPVRSSVELSGALICGLLAVVCVALVGGVGAALLATAVAVASAAFFFAVPYDSFRVAHLIDAIALIVFAACGGVIGVLVEVLAVGARKAAREHAQADQFARLLAETLARAQEPTAELAAELRVVFELDAVVILDRDGAGWRLLAGAGEPLPERPEAAGFAAEIATGRVLALSGRALTAPGSDLLQAFTAELLLARRRAQLDDITNPPSLIR
jgi:two-component system, OmpR family, sensor histidine kinase KdpD